MRSIAAGMVGAIIWLSIHWVAGLAAALFVLVWTRPAPLGKTIMVLDNETGHLTAQPDDKLTRDYLRKREM